jgi:hypothetical protein
VSAPLEPKVWAGWFTSTTIPNKLFLFASTGWSGCSQRYTRYGCPMCSWWPAQIGPSQYSYEVVVSFVGETKVWAGWFTFATIPNKVRLVTSTGWGGCSQRYTRYGGPMWSWRPAQIWPSQYTYEVVESFVDETKVCAGWFLRDANEGNVFMYFLVTWLFCWSSKDVLVVLCCYCSIRWGKEKQCVGLIIFYYD